MNVIHHVTPYAYKKPTKEEAVKAKMKVLKEFHVVNKRNAAEIETYLWSEIAKHSTRDYEIVLDQAAHTLIDRKMREL